MKTKTTISLVLASSMTILFQNCDSAKYTTRGNIVNHSSTLNIDINEGPDDDNDNIGNRYEEEVLGTDPSSSDTDGDGINDGDELDQGTDPKEPDSDNDGLNDGDEVNVHGTDPLKEDTDGDELNDGDEVNIHGTDPLKEDTDGDELNDGDEVSRGTDPTSRDSDNDGLEDKDEIDRGTDPLKEDTDGDGLKDGDEVSRGTDPFDEDSDNDGITDGAEVSQNSNPLDENSSTYGALCTRSNTTCSVSNGTGIQVINKLTCTYGSCQATSCRQGYRLSGGICVRSASNCYGWPSVSGSSLPPYMNNSADHVSAYLFYGQYRRDLSINSSRTCYIYYKQHYRCDGGGGNHLEVRNRCLNPAGCMMKVRKSGTLSWYPNGTDIHVGNNAGGCRVNLF